MNVRLLFGGLLCALMALPGVSGCRPTPASVPPPAVPVAQSAGRSSGWFEDIARPAGIDFALGHGGKTPLVVLEVMAAGVAIADFDGDGWMDLFLVGQEGTGNTGRCALYRNLGNERFQDVTAGSGLEAPGYYMGCAVGDLDNDGRPDLLVTGYGVNRLYRNRGNFRFVDVTRQSGLESPSPTSWHTSASFADIDNDGRLDVYIGRYVIFHDKTVQLCDYGKLQASCGPLFYDPQIGSLYRNLGGFRFKDVTRQMGVDQAKGKCLGVAFADVNGDGWSDFYLANDEMPGDLFINEKGRTFREEAVMTGVALSAAGQVQGAMGIDWGDYNRDGLLDLIVTTFHFEPTSLYAATRDGVFQNRNVEAGLDQPSRPYVGFGVKWVDLDNDGWLDLPVANGHIHDNQELIDKFSAYRQPIQLFMNQQGRTFVERTAEAGPGFSTPAVGRGLAVGDLNNDGLQDLVVCDLEGPVRVLINRMTGTGNWVRVKLEGTRSNRMGIGAQVRVVAGGRTYLAEARTDGSYLSSNDPRVHIGLGKARPERLEVRWPSGRKTVLSRPPVNRELTIREP
ncbi:MAG: CRTAC1 family protein [Chloroherpetonaceae bacterium]|nr:CRTAC1 family protein [Chthonomonadaceae bacterium]MDW8207802.1 CRTAC1 family protein [Chloroherpetonaceae bacterium]